jgi:Fe(II)/alpha-ketoglutarate-dependent arginine beta-hydroxylase
MGTTGPLYHLALSAGDNASLRPLLAELTERYDTIEQAELVDRARVYAARLPQHLLGFLEEFRLREPSALCLVSGLDIHDETLGPTPPHWRNSQFGSRALAQEVFFLLCGSVLGDIFGWSTQQDGRLMHDVLPIQGHEHYEIGSNSLQHLSWHSEDAFHPCRGDYVALMCLRNPDAVETVVCQGFDLDWDRLDVEALFEEEFTQLPDNSHRPENVAQSTGDATLDRLRARSFELIRSWNEHPPRRPILYGDPQDPYMALDPYHMCLDGWPDRSVRAYRELCEAIELGLRGIALQPGDCLFLDNCRAVHGRKSFRARYDGADRWLKRLNITRSLRSSRSWRLSPGSRIIY